jgi:peptide/nickel transport system permease protein
MKKRILIYKKQIVNNWGLFKKNKSGIAGLTLLVFFGILAFSAQVPLLISDIYHPIKGVDPEVSYSIPPTFSHPLGTDFMGRDIFSQLLHGAQIAFAIGIISALIAALFGTFVGLISGYFGGFIDTLLMRICDIMFTLPGLPFLIVFAAAIGKLSIWIIVIMIAIFGWPGTARVIRAQTLSLRERPYVDAARVAGANSFRIITKHIAPNVLPLTFLYMTFGISGAILTEAALSFLGLGDPSVMSWGMMLQWAFTTGHTFKALYWTLPPGLCISLLSLSFYLIGKGFDEIINPRLRER